MLGISGMRHLFQSAEKPMAKYQEMTTKGFRQDNIGCRAADESKVWSYMTRLGYTCQGIFIWVDGAMQPVVLKRSLLETCSVGIRFSRFRV